MNMTPPIISVAGSFGLELGAEPSVKITMSDLREPEPGIGPRWAVHNERPPLVQGVDQRWRQRCIHRPAGILSIGQRPEEGPPDQSWEAPNMSLPRSFPA